MHHRQICLMIVSFPSKIIGSFKLTRITQHIPSQKCFTNLLNLLMRYICIHIALMKGMSCQIITNIYVDFHWHVKTGMYFLWCIDSKDLWITLPLFFFSFSFLLFSISIISIALTFLLTFRNSLQYGDIHHKLYSQLHFKKLIHQSKLIKGWWRLYPPISPGKHCLHLSMHDKIELKLTECLRC